MLSLLSRLSSLQSGGPTHNCRTCDFDLCESCLQWSLSSGVAGLSSSAASEQGVIGSLLGYTAPTAKAVPPPAAVPLFRQAPSQVSEAYTGVHIYIHVCVCAYMHTYMCVCRLLMFDCVSSHLPFSTTPASWCFACHRGLLLVKCALLARCPLENCKV